jgi:hypothetical protein
MTDIAAARQQRTLITDLIERARDRAREEDAKRAVSWVHRGGWRIPDDDHFGEILAGYASLDEDDRAELWAYRRQLLEERQAE